MGSAAGKLLWGRLYIILVESCVGTYLMGYALCCRPLTVADLLRTCDPWHFVNIDIDILVPNLSFGQAWSHLALISPDLIRVLVPVLSCESLSANLTKKGVFVYACSQLCFSDAFGVWILLSEAR